MKKKQITQRYLILRKALKVTEGVLKIILLVIIIYLKLNGIL